MAIAVVVLLASACVPLPQRVQDEFSRYDGERPNNFLTGRDRAGNKESAQDTAE